MLRVGTHYRRQEWLLFDGEVAADWVGLSTRSVLLEKCYARARSLEKLLKRARLNDIRSLRTDPGAVPERIGRYYTTEDLVSW